LGHLKGSLSPKRSLSVAEIWRAKRQSFIWVHERKKEIHYNLVASCLSKLHSDPTFSIVFFSSLGPQTGSGAVPRSPETPRHSPPLRGRPWSGGECGGVAGVRGTAPKPEWGPRGEKREMENVGSECNFDKQLATRLQCISFLFWCIHRELRRLERHVSATDRDLFEFSTRITSL